MARRNAIIRAAAGSPVWGPLVAVLCVVLVGLGAAPPTRAAARSAQCGRGAVRIKFGKQAACVPRKVALPPPSDANPVVARVQGALEFAQLSFKAPSGQRVESFPQALGRSWATARGRLQNALAGILARVRLTARRPLGGLATASSGDAAGCAVADVVGDSSIEGGNVGKSPAAATIDGAEVTLGIDGGGLHLGLSTTVNGDKYTVKYDSGDVSCLAYKLPPCPEADGGLNAFGLKGKTGFSLTVQRGGKVLKREAYQKTISVETRGQVADDAKLDSVDVKYSETTNVVLDGTRLTQYGNRTTRINMRNGRYDPGESVSFGNVSAGGASANVAGVEADAKDFSTFVSQAISAYRSREDAWQTPNSCAKLKFNPASGTLTLTPGDKGGFSVEADAASGERAAKASWTLSGQQNGGFSPSSSKDPQPTFSYEVSSNPGGSTLSVTVRATSSAGVAQETWSQKLGVINKIAGTFSGHEVDDAGVTFDWSGSATFTRTEAAPGGVIYVLSAGQATVTVSGTSVDGCSHAGTEVIQLAPQGVFTVTGTSKPYQYQMIAPWSNTASGSVTVSCPGPNTFTQTEIPAAAAIQSGDIAFGTNPTGLLKTSADGVTFEGSAGESDPVVGSASWTWSLKGSV